MTTTTTPNSTTLDARIALKNAVLAVMNLGIRIAEMERRTGALRRKLDDLKRGAKEAGK